MSNWFAGEAGRPVGGDLVQVEVLGQVVEPDDGDDREDVAGDENSSSDVDKSIVLVADPIFVAQLVILWEAGTSPKQRLIRTLGSNINRLKLEVTTRQELFQITCLVHKLWSSRNWIEGKII